jgi:signal transduction histidine kinase
VRVGATESTVWFAVEDDDAGFDVARRRGTPLRNLLDRVAEMGGSIDIESAPARGTRVAGSSPEHSGG